MAQIKFRDFVDVYDDTENEYQLWLPKQVWEQLKKDFPESTKEIEEVSNMVSVNAQGQIRISGYASLMYGTDWWEAIEDELYATYADGEYIEIKHEKLLEH